MTRRLVGRSRSRDCSSEPQRLTEPNAEAGRAFSEPTITGRSRFAEAAEMHLDHVVDAPRVIAIVAKHEPGKRRFKTESGRPLAAAACSRAARLLLAGKIGILGGFRVGWYGMLS
jgi:hypothetical protein